MTRTLCLISHRNSRWLFAILGLCQDLKQRDKRLARNHKHKVCTLQSSYYLSHQLKYLDLASYSAERMIHKPIYLSHYSLYVFVPGSFLSLSTPSPYFHIPFILLWVSRAVSFLHCLKYSLKSYHSLWGAVWPWASFLPSQNLVCKIVVGRICQKERVQVHLHCIFGCL